MVDLRVTDDPDVFAGDFAPAGFARCVGRPGRSTKSGEPSDGIDARVGCWRRMFQTTAATVTVTPKTKPKRIQIGAGPVGAGLSVRVAAAEAMEVFGRAAAVGAAPLDAGAIFGGAAAEPAVATALLAPYGGQALYAYPVSTHVNTPAHDDARCLEPVAA